MTASGGPIREDADVESSSDQYAGRFAGPVGEWFLAVQAKITIDCLAGLPAGSTILDVGGGHAQIVPALLDAGYSVTVAGSDPSCAHRLSRWLDAGRCTYQTADLLALPYPDRHFDAVVCYRLLAHSIDWPRLVGELCRVARSRVVADYPSRRSVNLISDGLFLAKRRLEGGTTRRFLLFSPRSVRRAFEGRGFEIAREVPQFLAPMVLHRAMGSVRISRMLEQPARALGLTRWLGSPVIVRADRCDQSRGVRGVHGRG
jgi:2-polyprenyl-3-methyl-5-hydroxy-6-metoxy-1,4-benzoquinol methylase